MTYQVKEAFFTLQGEGARAGRSAVFCRFSGCNLWSGQEAHRTSAVCQFCDTDFVGVDGEGGGRFKTSHALATHLRLLWGTRSGAPYVVCTGGEPLLQLDAALVQALQAQGFEVAVETNGTLEPPPGLDWICVSPKAGAPLKIRAANELKLVYPQAQAEPARFVDLAFDHFFLQPMDGPHIKENTAASLNYCLEHPTWKLSIQLHKVLGIP